MRFYGEGRGMSTTREERQIITCMRRFPAIRPHIRHAFPPLLLWKPVTVICDHPESCDDERTWGARVMPLLKQAAHEPFAQLAPAWRDRGQTIALEVAKYGMAEAAERKPRAAIWGALTIMYWLEKMLDVEPSLLGEDSALHHAAFELLTAVQNHQRIADTYDKSARKGAVRLGRALARVELYPDAWAVFGKKAA